MKIQLFQIVEILEHPFLYRSYPVLVQIQVTEGFEAGEGRVMKPRDVVVVEQQGVKVFEVLKVVGRDAPYLVESQVQYGGPGGHMRYPLETQKHAADGGAETEAFGWASDRSGIRSAQRHHHHHQCQSRLEEGASLTRPPLTPLSPHCLRVTHNSQR